MAISKNKKPTLAKFTQGSTIGNAEKGKFSDWIVIYYTRSSKNGGFRKEIYGIDDNFDLVLIFEMNNITKQIAENTLFLVDEYPTSINTDGNFTVRKIVGHDNGEIVVGLTRRKSTQHKNIYYANGGEIYSYQLNYDDDTNKAYVDKYSTCPLEVGSVIWLFEPDGVDDKENRMVVTSVANVGIVDNLKVFKEYTFGEYSGD